MTTISSRRILVTFPQGYDIREAYNKVMSWKPDEGSIKWGLVNGIPNVHAKKESKFSIRLSKSLQVEGIKILSGDNITIFPILDNPPLNTPNNIPRPTSISAEFRETLEDLSKKLRDRESEIEELKTVIANKEEQILKLIKTNPPHEEEIEGFKIWNGNFKVDFCQSIEFCDRKGRGRKKNIYQRR